MLTHHRQGRSDRKRYVAGLATSPRELLGRASYLAARVTWPRGGRERHGA